MRAALLSLALLSLALPNFGCVSRSDPPDKERPDPRGSATDSAGTGSETDSGGAGDSEADTDPAPFEITSVTVEAIPANPLAAAVRVGVSAPAEARLSWDCEGYRGASAAQISGEDGALEAILEVWAVPQERDCALTVTATAIQGEAQATAEAAWRSGVLPAPIEIGLTRGAPIGDLTVLNPRVRGARETDTLYAVGVDGSGEVVWAYTDIDDIDKDRYAHPMPDGTIWLQIADGGRHITPGGRTLAEIANVDLDDTHHDICPLPDGDILLLEQDSREIDVPTLGGLVPVLGVNVVRLDPQGAVRWIWSSFDHLDTSRYPGALSREQRPVGYDWLHANAVSLNPDGRSFLLSLRHQSWIAQIDLDSGRIDWILGEGGDFTLTSGDWFYNQHGPQTTERGTVLVYDNGNERPGGGRPYSRAVEYRIDPDTREAEQIWAWTTPRYTESYGNVDLLANGNVLVTVGNIEQAEARVVEVTPSGDIGWQLDVGVAIYRAERLPPPEAP